MTTSTVQHEPAEALEGYRGPATGEPQAAPPAPAAEDGEAANLGSQIVREQAAEVDNEPVIPPVARDPRADLYARFKDRRDKESVTQDQFDPLAVPVNAQHSGNPAPDATASAPVEAPGDGLDAPPGEPSPAAAPRQADQRRYNLRVNRNDIAVDRAGLLRAAGLSEEDAADIPDLSLIKAAQLGLAREMAFQEAKNFRTAPATDGPAATPAHQSPEADAHQEQPQQQQTRSRRDLIEQMQLGSPEEAEQAMDALLDERLAARERQQQYDNGLRAVDTALQSFGQRNADILENPVAARLHRDIAAEEAIADLAAIGLSPQEQLQLQNDHALAARAHTAARLQGYQVRTPDQVFEAAAGRLRSEYASILGAAPTPQQQQAPPPVNPRVDAKRALPPQPPRVGSNPPLSARPPQAAPTRDTQSTIAKMAAARGQRLN